MTDHFSLEQPRGDFPSGSNSPLNRSLTIICALFVLLAWTYGLVMPAFENLDEIEHFSAIRFVAETGSLPVHDPVLQERYQYRQEASQPPLYYILMGGLTRLLALRTDDTNSHLVSNPFVACGPSDNPYNKHILYHDPAQEALSLDRLHVPWTGAVLTLHVLRALSSLLQVVTLIGVYAIARLVFPRRPQVALLATALVAFNPQFLLVTSGVNNDNLVTPLATLGLYGALVIRQRGLSFGRSIGVGLLAGLAGLSKLSGLLLLALVGLVLLESLWRARRDATSDMRSTSIKILGHGLLIVAAAALVCGWWLWRNWQLYGDPTALEPMLKLVGRRASPILPLNESGLIFRSYWGQIACAFFSDRFYLFFGLLTAAGLLGLTSSGLVSWRQGGKDRQSWVGMFWLTVWFGIVYVGWLRWDLLTPAPGGRLLFPAIASTSILLAYGLMCPWPTAWRGLVSASVVLLLAVVAVATLRWELRPFFTAPKTYAKASIPTISHPLEATFGSTSPESLPQIGLAGYDAELCDQAPYLDVTFYWQALAPLSQDYALAIQLTSPVPGDDTLRFNYNTWPGRGNYPTTSWSLGQIIADQYHFKLPASDVPTQAWQLLVAFYERQSGERLPVRIEEQEVGKGLILTTLRVPGVAPDCPSEAALDVPFHFGQQRPELLEAIISLKGALVRPRHGSEGSGLWVFLCWESLASAPKDYTVFVHLYDEDGELITTGDGPPMDGAFPTRLWQPGDEIVDMRLIPVTDADSFRESNHRVGVGLYDLASGVRLQIGQGGQPAPNDVVLLDIGP